jgi:CHAD domain-containing protein
MFARLGPSSVITRTVHDLLIQLPPLRDGEEEAIHQARVAIRRLREAVALRNDDDEDRSFEQLESRLAHAFKALGRARDADIAQRLVAHMEERFPLAPTMIGQLRSSVAQSRQETRRKMIKTLEAVQADFIPQQLVGTLRATPRFFNRGGGWHSKLRMHVARRAGDLHVAIAHASGVYFRNRCHAARVAIKRLRYALELATTTGTMKVPRAMKILKKAQEALGDAHDREVLLLRVQDLPDADGKAARIESRALEQFIRGEIQEAHARYLAARFDLLDICEVCERVPRSRIGVGAIAAASLALPAVFIVQRRGLLRSGRDAAVTRRSSHLQTA